MVDIQFIGLLNATLQAATLLFIAALGELITEKSGILNLGVEGMISIGAVSGFIAAINTGSLLYLHRGIPTPKSHANTCLVLLCTGETLLSSLPLISHRAMRNARERGDESRRNVWGMLLFWAHLHDTPHH